MSAPATQMVVAEFSGLALSAALDKVASATGTGTAPNSGSVTPATNGQLIIGMNKNESANGLTCTPGGSFISLANNNGNCFMYYQIQAIAAAIAAAATLPIGVTWAAGIATFKALAAAAPQRKAAFSVIT